MFITGTGKAEFPSISKKTGLDVLELKGKEIFQVSRLNGVVHVTAIAHRNASLALSR